MTAGSGFALHPAAADDITEIWEYIAKDNPFAAERVRQDLLEGVRKLVAFPRQGHFRPDLTARPIRFHVVGAYLIAYASDRTPLVVLAVLHGRRNPRVLAAILGRRT